MPTACGGLVGDVLPGSQRRGRPAPPVVSSGPPLVGAACSGKLGTEVAR